MKTGSRKIICNTSPTQAYDDVRSSVGSGTNDLPNQLGAPTTPRDPSQTQLDEISEIATGTKSSTRYRKGQKLTKHKPVPKSPPVSLL